MSDILSTDKLEVTIALWNSLQQQKKSVESELTSVANILRKHEAASQDKTKAACKFNIVKDFNCVIGSPGANISGIFGETEQVTFLERADIYDLLVLSGAFESKGQAKKNWFGSKEIPFGYNEIGPIGKNKLFLFVLNTLR